MSLDGKYFNALELELVKNKYYEADAVDDILLDIRKRAVEQAKEIEELKAQLEKAKELQEKISLYESQKEEISDTVIAAREAYKAVIEKANRQADEIIAESQKKAKEAEDNAIRNEAYYIGKFEKMYSRLRQSHSTAIDDLNTQWQDFLISLVDEDEDEEQLQDEKAPAVQQTSKPAISDADSLSEKISKIAKQISEI